jgi:hypothetical protein
MNYKIGDLFELLPDEGNIVIPHVCNDIGGWGSGFVLAVSKHFPLAETAYRDWNKIGKTNWVVNDTHKIAYDSIPFELGQTQFVQVKQSPPKNIWIANMIGQHNVCSKVFKPIRYAALVRAMEKVGEFARTQKAEIYCPKFGSDLAGGTWEFIVELIQEIWHDIDVTVCIFEG